MRWTIVKKSKLFFDELYIKKLEGIIAEQKLEIEGLKTFIKNGKDKRKRVDTDSSL